MAHNIKIKGVADFSGISKEVQNLGESVNKAFGKEKKIFDVGEIKRISAQTSTTFAKLSKDFTSLRKEAQTLAKEMKKAGNDETKISHLIEKRTENLKKQVLLQRDLAALKKVEGRVAGAAKDVAGFADVIPIDKGRKGKTFGGMAKQSIYTGAQDVASELPGIAGPAAEVGGGALKAGSAAAEAGMGVGAIAALGALAVVAGGAVVAIQRMKAGFEAFSAVVPDVIKLAGMGVTVAHGEGNRAIRAGAQMGFGEPEVLRIQEQENQAFGRAKNPEADNNRLIKTMGASRLLGLNPDQITQGGNQLRSVGGTQMAQREMGLILEKAVASGMDKTQSSAYLASAVGLLSQLNDSGVGNTNALLSTMTDLVSKGHMSPEQAAKSLSGLNSAIAGSSGESNAFFQGAMVKAGLGGGSLAGTQFAVRQGLVGINEGDLAKQVGDTKVGRQGIALAGQLGLTDSKFSQKSAGGILAQGNKMSGGDPQTYFTFMSRMLGTKNLPDTIKGLALLEKISKATDPKEQKRIGKELEDLSKTPAEKWQNDVLGELRNIQQNTASKSVVGAAMRVQSTEAGAKNAQIDLGAAATPIFTKLTDTLSSLDRTLAGMTNHAVDQGPMQTLGEIATLPSKLFEAFLDGVDELGEKLAKSFTKGVGELTDSVGDALRGNPVVKAGGDMVHDFVGAIESMFGSGDKPAGSAAAPPAATGGTGTQANPMDQHTSAIVNAIKEQTKALKPTTTAAPRGGRDLSRP